MHTPAQFIRRGFRGTLAGKVLSAMKTLRLSNKNASGFARRLLCCVSWSALLVVVAATPPGADAETGDSVAAKTLDGYIGAGARATSKYTGGAGGRTSVVPLLQFDYKEAFYVYLDRVGMRFWSSDDKKMALGIAAEPRFGFRAADGPRLQGMATRRDRVEGGPSFEWEMPQISLNIAYFTDWAGAGGGQSLRFYLIRQLLDSTRWDISAYAGFQRDSAKTVRYYFGVPADEATPDRPAYQPGASFNPNLGVNGAYKLGNGYALLFGADALLLGAGAGDSPIVERRRELTAYLGIGLVF
jgi:MipA family protein